MFKLESYVTPILLNYVAKYVKDFRDEDAQLSLWEGEVTFHNLDMRLDVLEQEMKLPFELVSGHIHDLTIQVPWTKLMSEPIRIVINTIEFVGKLKDSNATAPHSSPSRDRSANARRDTSNDAAAAQPTQPTSSGMVNKIINNISIECHNIILKYVEDDIVVSMNVQLLNFCSADEHWKPAMVDVHPTNVIIRKLLQVSDLTICLDKRNAAGRIDVCQEPILYRCTMEIRVIFKYNVNTAATTSILRLGLFTKSLDINVASLQVPMLMRLIQMLTAFKSQEAATGDRAYDQTPDRNGNATNQSESVVPSGSSYFTRAWNMLPSFEARNRTAQDELPGHTMDFGVYAEELNFLLKNSEYINDPAMGGMKRIRYTPIMRISLGGIYVERSSVKERDWGNIRAGLSSISVEPLGSYRTNDPHENTLVNTSSPRYDQAFIDKSLFDEQYIFAERNWCTTNYQDYTARITDEYMLYRSPVLAFDIVEYRAAVARREADTPTSNDQNMRIQYRLLSAGITFHYSQAFLQVKNVISDLIESHYYQEYYAETVNNPIVNTERHETDHRLSEGFDKDDFDEMISHSKKCNYRFEFREFRIHFYPKHSPDFNALNGPRPTININQNRPYLRLSFEQASGSLCMPHNSTKIVQFVSSLAVKPRELLDVCYKFLKFNIKNITLSLVNTTPDKDYSKLIIIPSLYVTYNLLLEPQLWRTDEAAAQTMESTCEQLTIIFSKREAMMVSRVISLVQEYNAAEQAVLLSLVSQASVTSDIFKLQTNFTKIRLNYRKYVSHAAWLFSIRHIISLACHMPLNIRNAILTINKGIHNKCLELQLQLPSPNRPVENESSAESDVQLATVIALWIEPMRIIIDTYLLEFVAFQAQERVDLTKKERSIDNETTTAAQQTAYHVAHKSSITSVASSEAFPRRTQRNTRRISQPEETVHYSSERDDKNEPEPNTSAPVKDSMKNSKIDVISYVNFLKTLVITMDIAQSIIMVSELVPRRNGENPSNKGYTNILLPKIKLRSMYGDIVTRSNIRTRVHIPAEMQSCSWTIDLLDMELQHCQEDTADSIILPIRTTIIAALTHRITDLSKSHKTQHAKLPRRVSEDDNSYFQKPKKVDWKGSIELHEYYNMEEDNVEMQVVSLNLHADTSEIHVYGHWLKELYDDLCIAFTVYNSLATKQLAKDDSPEAEEKHIIVAQPGEDNGVLKEFLEIDHTVVKGESQFVELAPNAIIVFCQWTIPRIQLELESESDRLLRKIVLDCEDLLLNVDKHVDFTKYSCKLQNCSLNYYENEDDDWVQRDVLSVRMFGDSTNLPLLSVIVTIVSLNDLHYKIGIRNVMTNRQTISEVLISLLHLEIVVDLDEIMEFFMPLCELFQVIKQSANSKSVDTKTLDVQKLYSVNELPMVHVSTNGITLYVPLETGRDNCSVLVWKVEQIDITPHLDNPLQRSVIRADVFNKAAQLGMLGTPGALIEDRQYELGLKNMLMYTAKWSEALVEIRRQRDANTDNPAVEWNNQINQSELKSDEIFKDFTLFAIYAPLITYKNILICGQNIEFNCASDFVAKLNVTQVNLLSCIYLRLQRLSSIMDTTCATKQFKRSTSAKSESFRRVESPLNSDINLLIADFGSSEISKRRSTINSLGKRESKKYLSTTTKELLIAVAEGSIQSDSGIQIVKSSDSMESTSVSLDIVAPRKKLYIPNTTTLVAGIFTIKIFDAVPSKQQEEEIFMRPLICCTISQPSFMFKQNVRDAEYHASIFNFNVHIPNYTNLITLHSTTFTEALIDTQPGNLNSSGIPPPLLSYKASVDRNNYREIDIDFRKPIIIHCLEDNVQRVATDLVYIYTTMLDSRCFDMRSDRPVVHCSKLRQLQLQCFNADRFRFMCNHIAMKFSDEKDDGYKCKTVLSDIMCNINFNKKPEKATIRASLGTFYLKTENKIFVHPIASRLSADLISEKWHAQPLVNASLKFNVVYLDVGILMIVQLRKASEGLKRITNHIHSQWQNFLNNRASLTEPATVSRDRLQELKTPSVYKKKNKSIKDCEEFYQDDLRAGAFQFVDLKSDAVLPLPYQIQIIKKNFGIICWRYPQPRLMVRIEIFPVPMPVNNPIHIRCRMEYFSEAHETFLHYSDFLLSETSAKLLKLPERDICANIWRVVIMQSLISVNGECFDTSEEDEELQSIASTNIEDDFKNESDNDFILHPKALVGCMRVDTAFQPKVVPKFQMLLSCNRLLINFLSQSDNCGELPPQLKKYQQAKITDISQTFCSLKFHNLTMHGMFYSKYKYSMELGFLARATCLDYGFLNMLDLLEPMTFQSYLRVNKMQRLTEANVLIDKFRLNCGPSILHSFLISKHHWELMLCQEQKLHALLPKCVVINRTQSYLAFGQSGTNERINLLPTHCYLYHFRSDYHTQNLTFFMLDDTSKNEVGISGSLHIPFKLGSENELHYLRIGNKCIIVKLSRLSNTQIYVLIKGQIELVSMVPFDIIVEFRSDEKEDSTTHESVEYTVQAKGHTSFYRSVQRNNNMTMRIKLNNGSGKGRTGDIPLKPNNSLPWLVKVPLQKPYEFISVWARILREDIPIEQSERFQPQKLLISIWPVFEICNMLSCPLDVTEATTSTTLEIPGEGGSQVISTPATHLTEHKMTFKYAPPLGKASSNDYTLMLKAIDWHTFFNFDETVWTVENANELLDKDLPKEWPLASDDEELRVIRNYESLNAMDVQYLCHPTREFSCTLGLEVSAWGMFINASDINISVYVPTTRERHVYNANCLEMMTIMVYEFTIDVPFGTNWIASMPIYLEDTVDTITTKPGPHLILSRNSTTDVVILRNDEVVKFVLEYKVEYDRRVFKLRPKFVLANFTDTPLTVLPMAMDHKENSTRYEVQQMDAAKKNKDLPPTENGVGVTLDVFFDINARKAKRSSDTAFVYFICFLVAGNLDVSIPIPLALPFTRRCFSVQNDNESVPLVVTLIEQNGIFYLCVFKDTAPALLVSNHTNVKFIVAQTSASGNSNVTNTTSEYMGKHFEWFQLVSPLSKCYYTPPEMYANFPDVEYSICNLSLAVYNEDKACNCVRKKINWSKPIRTDRMWKKFLHVPNHGDVKVVVCDKHRVKRVNIYYVSQQMEFSVKDLRSRLLSAPNAETYTHPSDINVPLESVPQLEPLNADSDVFLAPQTSSCMHFSNDCETKQQLIVCIYIKQLVFSLQADNADRDYIKTEVCNLYADDLMLAFENTDDRRMVNVLIPNLQIDNQLYSSGKYDFPVLLCGELLYRRTNNLPQLHQLQEVYHEISEQVTPMVLLTFDFYQDEYKLSSVNCQFSPFRAYIEDAYINQMLEALVDCDPSSVVYKPKPVVNRIKLSPGQVLLPEHVIGQALCIAEPLLLRSFTIQPLQILLSVHTSMRMYIALDHSPLSFSRYECQQMLTVPLRFGQSVGMHYLSGAIFGAGWMVGSLEILGSPSGLARSFSTGLRDFISMPVQGLFRGPWGFIVGITQGSASLFRNVTAGTVNSVTKLASSVARNLDRLTLDQEHIERTEALRRSRPQGFTQGLTQGMTGLGISILGAVGGLAHHTLEARSSVGVITGLTKGIVGAFAKPISGAAEMLALAGQGVLHTVGFNAMPQQVEPCVSRNMAVNPSGYRIWQLLPSELHSDQILFYHPITLLVEKQLRAAYAFLTSAVLALLETDNDKLAFVAPVNVVELLPDRDDRTKYYLRQRKEHQDDDIEEHLNYTNERIMKFLNSSSNDFITTESLDDLLNPSEVTNVRNTDWVFYIEENLGEHLMHYLKVINKN